jgi:glycine/D-amino acid oxidase-like deaminating enzyme
MQGEEPPDLQFRENGYLFLASESGRDAIMQNHEVQKGSGADWMEILERDGLAKRFPWLNLSGISIGSFGLRNEGFFDPWALVNAMKKRAISLGVTYMEAEVVGAQMSDDCNINHLTLAPTGPCSGKHVQGTFL